MTLDEAIAASPNGTAYRREVLSVIYVRFRYAGTVRIMNGKIVPVEDLWDEELDWQPTPIQL